MSSSDTQLMIDVCRQAGNIAMTYFRTDLTIDYKPEAGNSPVTIADKEVDAFIKKQLLAVRPHYGWLSEEDTNIDISKEKIFVLDAIDGTIRFIDGIPEFSIALGLIENGKATEGVVYNPATDELFDSANIAPYQQKEDLCLVSPGLIRKPYAARAAEKLPLKPLGSGAYKLGKLAAGEASSVVITHPLSTWDVAAPAAICQRAGITLTTISGTPVDFTTLPYGNIVDSLIAAPEETHADVLKIVQELIQKGVA